MLFRVLGSQIIRPGSPSIYVSFSWLFLFSALKRGQTIQQLELSSNYGSPGNFGRGGGGEADARSARPLLKASGVVLARLGGPQNSAYFRRGHALRHAERPRRADFCAGVQAAAHPSTAMRCLSLHGQQRLATCCPFCRCHGESARSKSWRTESCSTARSKSWRRESCSSCSSASRRCCPTEFTAASASSCCGFAAVSRKTGQRSRSTSTKTVGTPAASVATPGRVSRATGRRRRSSSKTVGTPAASGATSGSQPATGAIQ